MNQPQPRIVVFPGRKRLRRQWFYRVVAANGETLVVSEAFTRPSDATRAATNLRVTMSSTWLEIAVRSA